MEANEIKVVDLLHRLKIPWLGYHRCSSLQKHYKSPCNNLTMILNSDKLHL